MATLPVTSRDRSLFRSSDLRRSGDPECQETPSVLDLNVKFLVEVTGICSNPPRRLRHLFETWGPGSLSQVSEPKTTASDPEGLPGDLIPYSPRQHLTPHEIERLLARYQAGSTAKELGDLWGVHRATVSALLKERGVQLRNRPLDEGEVSAAIRLYQSGLSLAAVGQRLSRDPNSVRLALLRAGVPRRDTHGRPPG